MLTSNRYFLTSTINCKSLIAYKHISGRQNKDKTVTSSFSMFSSVGCSYPAQTSGHRKGSFFSLQMAICLCYPSDGILELVPVYLDTVSQPLTPLCNTNLPLTYYHSLPGQRRKASMSKNCFKKIILACTL